MEGTPMKSNLNKALVPALVVVFFCAPGGLLGQGEEAKERDFIGFKGGFSLLPDASADAVYPGIYPNKPIFGVFLQGNFFDQDWHSEWIEVLYLDQSALYDLILRDDLGNIIAESNVECSRQYLEFIVGCKLRSEYRKVTPFLLSGGAMSVLLRTSREPDIVDPEQPKFKGPAFSVVVGVGLEATVGRLFLSLDVRYDYGAMRAFSDRTTPKPNALLFTAGIGWNMGRG
jgi:hypothetical protein